MDNLKEFWEKVPTKWRHFTTGKNTLTQEKSKRIIDRVTKNLFNHMLTEPNLPLTYGLDIDKIDTLRLGDMTSMNPFQIHCTTDYDKFNHKWILRFLITKKM